MSRGFQQLGDDLGIGLAVKTDLPQTGGISHLLGDCGHDRPSAGAGGEEDGAIDIEEDQFAFQRSSNRLTATSLGRSVPPRVPGSHGSISIPPHARVEWISVSASPANATWVIPLVVSPEKKSKSPGRIASSPMAAP